MGAELTAAAITSLARVCDRRLALAMLVGLLWAGTARAEPAAGADETEPQAFRVVFSSSSVCSNPSEFVEQLQRRTKHLRPANAVEPALTFYVSLTSTEAGVQGNLRVLNADGTGPARQVPGLDCHEVLSAMALIGALTVDPFALTGEDLPPPAPSVPSRPLTKPSEPESKPEPKRFRFGVGQRLNVNGGVLPGLGWGESVLAEASVPVSGVLHPSVRLAGHVAHATKETELSPPLGTGAFEWRAARLALCPVLWSPAPWFGARPCVFADAGRLRARGSETTNGKSNSRFWAASGLELELQFELVGPLTLGAEAGFMLPLVPRDPYFFVPRGANAQVHQISGGFAGGFGFGLRFF